MSKTIELVTVLPREVALQFIQTKRVEGLDTMPQINKHIKGAIRDFIRNNVGYDIEPIAAISRYNGSPGELKLIGTNVAEVIPAKAGSTLWQLKMPEDMAVSINFGDLLSYSTLLEESVSEEEVEFYLEEFNEKLSLGYLDDEDVVSFIPFIDFNRCEFYAIIENSWEVGKFSMPAVKEVTLMNLDVFN